MNLSDLSRSVSPKEMRQSTTKIIHVDVIEDLSADEAFSTVVDAYLRAKGHMASLDEHRKSQLVPDSVEQGKKVHS